MGESVELGRCCARCGEQVTLSVDTERGTYTDDLEALLSASPGSGLLVEARCGCPSPRQTVLKSATKPQLK